MKRWMKKLVSGAVLAGMIVTSPGYFPTAGKTVKAAENDSVYEWDNHDRNIIYPASETTAEADSTQSGYGAERMLDGNTDTRWEASWNNAPEEKTLTFRTKDGEPEYFTGVKYVSRMDNNISGTMSGYKIYASEDGSSYGEEPVTEGEIVQKLGTFYLDFEEPVKASAIRIISDIGAAAEMRLMYIPTDEGDYTELLGSAEALRSEAEENKGEDIGQWRPSSLEAFDTGLQIITGQGEQTEQDARAEVNGMLVSLTSDLKRALLTSTTELNQKLREAEGLLNAANVGNTPLTYSQEAVDAFAGVISEVTSTADNGAAQTGAVQDAQRMLEDGIFDFKASQNKPAITYTGTEKSPLSYIMDLLTESHFQGEGTGKDIYLELDYGTELEFESLTFQTWFATQQCIKRIKVDYKNSEGEWLPVDSGKEYTMNWATNTSTSEMQKVNFDESVKGTALRIYILDATSYYVVDELTVGTAVSADDVQIILDRTEMTLSEGETGKLTATVLPEYVSNKNVVFSSSNEAVLTVDSDGILTVQGLPEGSEKETVIVTAATEYGNKTAQCVVTVIPKTADEEDKQDTQTRLKIARKLADAAADADYKDGAVRNFSTRLDAVETKLEGEITVGELAKLDTEIRNARTEFEEASLIPIRETKNLIDRITGEGSSEKFIVEMIPADEETGGDVYEVDWDAEAGKPVLRGNDGVSLATAYNYYLKYFAYLDFPYVGECDLELPEDMPEVTEPVHIVFPYEYRHYFNENCEYKYTTDLYGEEEWQHRIDWMAMNGFNMFLMDLGEHAVWYNAKDELGLNDAAINELQHYSNGTEQYEGKYEISIDAILKEGALAKKVVEMAFKAGMEPEVRPFVGQVPFMFPEQHDQYYESGDAKMTVTLEGSVFDGMFLYSAAKWINLPQGVYISPETAAEDADKAEEMKEKYIQISDIYYESLMEVLGYNEWGRTPEYVYKDMVGEQGFVVQHEAFPQKVIAEMNDQLMKLNPDALWLQTSWRYQSWLPQYYDEGNLMFVDLSAENRPKWNTNNEFGGTPWLWSMLFNFGGNSGIEGDLKGLAADVLSAKESSNYMKGVSISPEGGDTNPALYAMMAEMTWRSEAPDMEQWVTDYIKRRYGAENYEKAKKELESMWEILCSTVYKDFVNYDGPAQTLINAYPKLSGAISRTYGSNAKLYETQELIPVWEMMLKAAAKMDTLTPQFEYDLVDITRQILADISGEVYSCIKPAFDSGDKETAMKYAEQMIEMCRDMDEILATNVSFLVGTRHEGARNRGVTDSDKAFYEQVERTFETYWVLDDTSQTSLTDYCNRHLSGLMTDYYGMRWEVFAKYLEQALDEGMDTVEFNSVMAPKIKAEIAEKEEAWSKEQTIYPTEPEGAPAEVSAALLEKYRPLIEELYGASDTSRDLSIEGMTATAGNVQSTTGTEGPASNVLDDDPSTIWHTAWAGTALDVQWIDISLNEKQLVAGLRYLPRQAGGVNGIITGYEIYVSGDGGQTYTKVSEGEWSQNTVWKIAEFDAVEATNVKLQVTSAVSDTAGRAFASAAEIRLMAPVQEPEEPVDPDEISTSVLEYALEFAETADTEGVIDSVAEVFNNAKAAAWDILEKVQAGDSAVTQEMVDESWRDLIKAMQYLSFKRGDKTDLQTVIDLAKSLDLSEYLDEGQQAFTEALTAAEAVLADGDVMQDEVNQSWRNLLKAMSELRLKPNKDALEALIAEAENLNTENTDEEIVAVLRSALAKAIDVYDNEQAEEDEVSAAEKELEAAIDQMLASMGGSTENPSQTENSNGNTNGSANGDQQGAAASAGTTAAAESQNSRNETNGFAASAYDSKSVKSGDNVNFLLWAVLLAAAGAAGGAAVRASRRKK